MTSGQTEANREFGEYDTDPDERGTAHLQKGQNEKKGPASERTKQLAQHKEPKSTWYTCVGPKVRFGTQEPMWPVSASAMAASASSRVQTLATPKRNFQAGTVHEGRPFYYYSAGRPSVIWAVSEGAKNGSSTERLQELAKHKQFHPEYAENKGQFYYSCGRESPVWKVQVGNTQPPERSRTTLLARHRDYHPEFLGERPIQTEVTREAQSCVPGERLINLALPVKRPDGPFRHPQWPVAPQALTSMASSRSCELAKSKPLAEGFQHARGMEWPVSKAAKQAVATPRLEKLSRPITRGSMDSVQFDPNAFTVKQSALKGVIPGRIQDLAQPANR